MIVSYLASSGGSRQSTMCILYLLDGMMQSGHPLASKNPASNADRSPP
jgi:hypothetical protein